MISSYNQNNSNITLLSFRNRLYKNLQSLNDNKDNEIIIIVINMLADNIDYFQNKEQTAEYLINYTRNGDVKIRASAAFALGKSFADLPDKHVIQNRLFELANDPEVIVRKRTIQAIGLCFNNFPKKNLAWRNLDQLASDKESGIRASLCFSFKDHLNYSQYEDNIWKYLQKFVHSPDKDIRLRAADAIGRYFKNETYGFEAWKELCFLLKDNEQTNIERRRICPQSF